MLWFVRIWLSISGITLPIPGTDCAVMSSWLDGLWTSGNMSYDFKCICYVWKGATCTNY